jgi:hypothetical protein
MTDKMTDKKTATENSSCACSCSCASPGKAAEFLRYLASYFEKQK